LGKKRCRYFSRGQKLFHIASNCNPGINYYFRPFCNKENNGTDNNRSLEKV